MIRTLFPLLFAFSLLFQEAEGSYTLLFFTGSDCSGWSMKMKKEILLSEAFQEKTKQDFKLVEIDFPQHKVLNSEVVEKNEQLKQKWHVHEFPRLIVLDEKERELARFSYPEKEALSFADELLELVQKDRFLTQSMSQLEASLQLSDLYKLARELKRDEEALVILEAAAARGQLNLMLEKYRFLVEQGQSAPDLRKQIEAGDPLNEKGMLFSLALIDFEGLANLGNKDPALQTKPLVDYLSKFGERDDQNRWRLEMLIAQVYLNFDEWETALKHAEVAYRAAPVMQQSEIGQTVAYIRTQAEVALK